MTKQDQQRKKLQQEKRHLKKRAARLEARPKWPAAVAHARELVAKGQLPEARRLLEDFVQHRPADTAALAALLEVYLAQRDYGPYSRVCEQLLELESDNAHRQLLVAEAYFASGRVVAALQAFEQYLERWPDEADAARAKTMVAELSPGVNAQLESAPFPAAERLELAARHESMLVALAMADYARVVREGEVLAERAPRFVAALNNLAEAYRATGRADEGIAALRKALEVEPENVVALASLARQLLPAGRKPEAIIVAEKLASLPTNTAQAQLKRAEAFSFLGEDARVIAAFEAADKTDQIGLRPSEWGLFHHLAAVAYSRTGDQRMAQPLWQRAIELFPRLKVASNNLDNSMAPTSERYSAWPFTVNDWIPPSTSEDLIKFSSDNVHGTQLAAQSHPELVALVPDLLDRGDDTAVDFIVAFAQDLNTPEMLEALRVFALSQRGCDRLRFAAALHLCREGVLPPGKCELWLRGKRTTTELVGFEVVDERTGPEYPPKAGALADRAHQALERRDGATAESLLKQAIEIAGERPELLNNLAMAYSLQGRRDEQTELAQRIHATWPDYFFGIVGMANLALRNGDLPAAAAQLATLPKQGTIHVSQFAALCQAHVHLHTLQKDVSAAKNWLSIWEHWLPNDERIDALAQKYQLLHDLSEIPAMSNIV